MFRGGVAVLEWSLCVMWCREFRYKQYHRTCEGYVSAFMSAIRFERGGREVACVTLLLLRREL